MNQDDPITLPPLIDFRDLEIIMKICKNCHKEKKLSQFYKNKHMNDGHVNVCIKCKVVTQVKRKALPSEISLLLVQWAKNTRRAI